MGRVFRRRRRADVSRFRHPDLLQRKRGGEEKG
jgi:hypothetical protein